MTGFSLAFDLPTIDRTELEILGGQIDLEQLREFLCAETGWGIVDPETPWLIWEEISTVWFGNSVGQKWQIPPDLDLFERLRCFGPLGDLTIRRDGNTILFYFVGLPDRAPPAGHPFRGNSWWDSADARSNPNLIAKPVSQLLWGKYREDMDQWYDNTVARAELRYPVSNSETGKPERVQIDGTEYIRGGNVNFVRWHSLSEHSYSQ